MTDTKDYIKDGEREDGRNDERGVANGSRKITTIIFDCFGVLCTPVLFKWYSHHSAKHGFADEELPRVFKDFDLGLLSEEDILERFSKYDGVAATAEQIRNETDAYLELDQELVRIIKDLKEKGMKIALLSNANHSFFERKIYVDYPEFKDLFDAVVISSVVKMVKPDREIYEHVLAVVGSSPDESIFVDDSQTNVTAAEKLGMVGHLYTDPKAFGEYTEIKLR